MHNNKIQRICLIAGDFELPIKAYKEYIKHGVDVVVFAITQSAFINFQSVAPKKLICQSKLNYQKKIRHIHTINFQAINSGELVADEIFDNTTLQEYNSIKNFRIFSFSLPEIYTMTLLGSLLQVDAAVCLGKIPKLDFFASLNKFDLNLLSEFNNLDNMKDDSLHELAASKIKERTGVDIINQTLYLDQLFPDEQIFTDRKPNTKELKDIMLGFKTAKLSAGEDIGQTAVISNQSVYAIEAIEGTDECIRRAKKLSQQNSLFTGLAEIIIKILDTYFQILNKLNLSTNKDIKDAINFIKQSLQSNHSLVVTKVAKPSQDRRFDIPAIGLKTIKTAGPNSILAFEASKTFFIDQEQCIQYANKNNICICAISLE